MPAWPHESDTSESNDPSSEDRPAAVDAIKRDTRANSSGATPNTPSDMPRC